MARDELPGGEVNLFTGSWTDNVQLYPPVIIIQGLLLTLHWVPIVNLCRDVMTENGYIQNNK